jgi:anti-anti-sigma factor
MYGLAIRLEEGPPPVLHVRGDIDIANTDEFAAALEDATSADPALAVDMTETTFIDLAGLRVLLRTAESLNGAGPLRLVNATCVARLLDVLGIEETSSLDLGAG